MANGSSVEEASFSFAPISSFHQYTSSYLFACEYQPMYCFEQGENKIFPFSQLVVDVLICRFDGNSKKLAETNTGRYESLGKFTYQYYAEEVKFEIFQKVIDDSFYQLSPLTLEIPGDLSLPQPPFLPRALKSPSQVLPCAMGDLAKAAKLPTDTYLVFSSAITIPALKIGQAEPPSGFSPISVELANFQLALYVDNKLFGACKTVHAYSDFQEISMASLQLGENFYRGTGFKADGKLLFYDSLAGCFFQLSYQEGDGFILEVNWNGLSLPLTDCCPSEQANQYTFSNGMNTFHMNLSSSAVSSALLYSIVLNTPSGASRTGYMLYQEPYCTLFLPDDSASSAGIHCLLKLRAGNVLQGECSQVPCARGMSD